MEKQQSGWTDFLASFDGEGEIVPGPIEVPNTFFVGQTLNSRADAVGIPNRTIAIKKDAGGRMLAIQFFTGEDEQQPVRGWGTPEGALPMVEHNFPCEIVWMAPVPAEGQF